MPMTWWTFYFMIGAGVTYGAIHENPESPPFETRMGKAVAWTACALLFTLFWPAVIAAKITVRLG